MKKSRVELHNLEIATIILFLIGGDTKHIHDGIGGILNPGGDGRLRTPENGDSNKGTGTQKNEGDLNKEETPSKTKRGGGGFKIDFRPETANANRSRYISDKRLIIINLDHPQVESIKNEYGIEGRPFKFMAHEIAFTEYALAVVTELAVRGIKVSDAFDALVQCREIIDRATKRAAKVYSIQSLVVA